MLKREEMSGFDWEEESACLYVIEVTGGYRQSGAQMIFKFHAPPPFVLDSPMCEDI